MPEVKETTSKSKILDTLLNAIPTFLAFTIPIFFLPLTTEFFEFNKLTLVIISTILMAVLWAVKMLINREVKITKSPLDLSILALVVTTLLATIFSLHKTSSIFGVQGRWFPSLFGTLVLALFYYITTENITSKKTVKTTMYGLLLGISISTLVAIFGYYGVKLGQAPFLQVTGFTLTGSITTTAILASVGAVLALTGITSEINLGAKLFLMQAVLLNFFGAIILGSTASWIVLGAGLLAFAFFVDTKKLVENKTSFLIVTGAVLAIVIAMVTPTTRDVITNENYPSEIHLSPRESWIVVSSIMRDFPILGTGPSTFGLNYTRYKPASINSKNYWNVRFNTPYSQAFSIIGSLGILGIVVGISLVVKIANLTLDAKREAKDRYLSSLLAVGVVSLVTSLFVTTATVTTAFLLVLMVTLLVVQGKIEHRSGVESNSLKLSSLSTSSNTSLVDTEKEVFQYIMAVPLFALAGVASFYTFKQYAGEYFMRGAVKAAAANNGSLTYQLQQKAINANPGRSSYHNSYANTSLALANSISSREELSDDEKTTVQNLISQAIRSTKVSTEIVNPLKAGSWEIRATTYSALSGVAEDADGWATSAYTQAIQLDPTNPRLRMALGGIHYKNEDYLSAANQFNLATSLKADYANAHYNLAQALKQLENYKQALTELRIVQRLVDKDSPDYEAISKELEALKKNPAIAGTETKPTIEEIEAAAQEKQEVQQEPITNVGEEQAEETLDVEEEITVEENQEVQTE